MPLTGRACFERALRRARKLRGSWRCGDSVRDVVTATALVVTLLAGAGIGEALDGSKRLSQYAIDIWKNGQGIPVNSIVTMAQTADGYLWLGTQSGLVRFDGIGSRSYHRRNTPGLPTSIVWSLLGLRSGELWVGLEYGGVVIYDEGRFERLAEEELEDSTVMALLEDSSGAVWIGTEDGHVFRFFDGSTVRISPEEGLGGSVRDFEAAGIDGVWAATEGSGLWRLEPDGPQERFSVEHGLPTNVVISLGSSRDGALWVGTHAAGTVRIFDGDVTAFTVEDGLPHNTVNEIVADRDGNVWFATQQGLSRLTEAGELTAMTLRQGSGANVVRLVTEDREGSLWVGTGGGGLWRLKDSPVTTIAVREGLEFDHVWTVYEDSQQIVWIGSGGGGLFRLKEGDIRNAFSTANGLSNDTVLSLAEDPDGSLWVGTRDGLNHLKNGTVTVFREADGLPNAFVRVLAVDRKERMWVGTREGLALYENGHFRSFDESDGLNDDVIRFVLEARDGTIWIGTNGGGLYTYDETRFTALTEDDGLSAGYVFAIHEDRSGTIWAGTNEGLNRIRNGRIDVLTIDDGLPDDFIYRILEDDANRLWMSTNAGIVSVPLAALNGAIDLGEPIKSMRAFGTADGMLNPECNGGVQPAGWKDHTGALWFPTVQGVAHVDPSRIRRNTVPPNVVIDRIVVDGEELSKPREEALQLGPGSNRIEVHYAALSLLDPAKVRYRYRLAGFESDWTDAGTRRTAYYTNVPPGQYRFQVTGCNNDGVWSASAESFDLELEPTFAQTGWMVLLYALVGAAIVGGLFVLRTRQLRLRERRLLTLVDERTAQLESANQKLEILVNQDGLTGITSRRHFMQLMEQEWKRCERSSQWISVILADIDDFKVFNDTYGHQAGDDCLRKIAEILDSCVGRPADVVARYGGEEFIVLLPATDTDGAVVVAEAMRKQVLEVAIPHMASRAMEIVSVSFGVAGTQPDQEASIEHLIERADAALYQAKEGGRNRTVRAPDEDDTKKLAALK